MEFDSDIVIGLECHISLKTKTKLFCSCLNGTGSEEPNTLTCEVCLGHPGSKPILNKKAVQFATKLGLALKCKVAEKVIFSRKSYFYPDLSKNYQISQYELPIASSGVITLPSGKKVEITRAHLEEDPASLVHPKSISESNFVLIDYNRSGAPLIEIVTEPCLTSASEAREFMNHLVTLLHYLDIFDINTCTLKADANISIKESGYVRSEIKNVTGFKEIERALIYEIERQKKVISSGDKLVQDTRGWDASSGKTFLMRTKETQEDYGYIIDPDLVPIYLSKFIDDVELPELPYEKATRFIEEYKIGSEDAHILVAEKGLGDIFDTVSKKIDPILVAKWSRHQLVKVMNKAGKSFSDLNMSPDKFIDLLNLVQQKKITDAVAEEILANLIEKSFNVEDYVLKNKLEVVSDTGELELLCQQIIEENSIAVQDYKNGEEKSFNFLVGKVMQKTKGKADPNLVNEILKQLIINS
jgi:aspartyl-tRNA(Asn)/glutamyl-tRNA(Gln) amidotransferase subunit B